VVTEPRFDPVARAAEQAPDAPALLDQNGWLTWHDLSARVDEWARLLARAGAAPGQRVTVVVQPGAAGVTALFAALRTGAVLVPLHSALTAAELRPALAALRPAAVVCEEANLFRLGEAMPAAPGAMLLAVNGDVLRPVAPGVGAPPPRSELPGVAVVWTSGTSGSPRGVLLTAAGFESNTAGTAERLGLEPSDRWMLSLNHAHVGGLALVVRAALLGVPLVPLPQFDGAAFLALAERWGVTHASLVPTHLHRVIEALGDARAPETFRAILLGGAASPPPLVRSAGLHGLPVAVTYGLTEATSQVATATPDESQELPGSPGRPLPSVEVDIGEDGSVRVRGAVVAAGAVRAAEGEDGPTVVPLVDSDGWLDTGDLGHLDADGRLHVTGRRSDRIISGGVNVDPVEVERVLLAHPSVVEASVVGVPDPEWGERVVAAVAFREDGPFPGSEALSAYLRGRLVGAKRPKELHPVAALPRNPNGKVDRAAVRALFRSG
jgi:o-succinylbenzoate---CoA ligase